jgi:hypothetical protein
MRIGTSVGERAQGASSFRPQLAAASPHQPQQAVAASVRSCLTPARPLLLPLAPVSRCATRPAASTVRVAGSWACSPVVQLPLRGTVTPSCGPVSCHGECESMCAGTPGRGMARTGLPFPAHVWPYACVASGALSFEVRGRGLRSLVFVLRPYPSTSLSVLPTRKSMLCFGRVGHHCHHRHRRHHDTPLPLVCSRALVRGRVSGAALFAQRLVSEKPPFFDTARTLVLYNY